MALSAGTRLGTFEILAPLGAGGMGEVYRARDTKLGRDVAIKVLAEQFAKDTERLARFEREARLLASLNHPNIASIHGFEDSDGVKALVLELVEGPTLAERIHEGAIPVDEAIAIAKQIAEALEAGHEAGVIHRDLKPANIKLKEDGTVKVLDYGLAKALAGDPSSGADSDLSQSPTFTRHGTQVGVILGTAAYMSPEQAKGKRVDKRTDIWAFGAVLFEMLSGRRAFDGDAVSDTLASVLRDEPDWTSLPANTPPLIQRLLHRCLDKNRKHRLDSAADARLDIEDAQVPSASVGAVPVIDDVGSPVWRRALTPVAIALVGAAIAWLVARQQAGALPVMHLQMSVRPADQLSAWYTSSSSVRPSRTAVAISPDARWVTFDASRGTVGQLYMRWFHEVEATAIQGTEGAVGPFLSPDGAWIGFWAENKIKKVPAGGGPAVTVTETTGEIVGATWGETGDIFFGDVAGIFQVSSAGGAAAPLFMQDASKGERYLLPHVLPRGKALLFTAVVGDAWETAAVVLQALDTGARRVLIEGGADARYVSTGHLVYVKFGTIMAVPFDLSSLEVTGAPVALIEDVMQAVNAPNTDDETGAGQFTVSTSGTLLYVRGGAHPLRESSLTWADRAGVAKPLPAVKPGAYIYPRLSPDERRIAVTVGGNTSDVWVFDVLRGAPTRLTFGGGRNEFPIWSPDGKRLVFASNATGVSNLYAINADGSGKLERLTTSEYAQAPSSWSASDNVVAYSEEHDGEYSQIWVLPLDGDREPKLFLESRFFLAYPEFSPDGRWLAYVSSESGEAEVYVQRYPGPGEKHRISLARGYEPIWSANGMELLFRIRKGDRTGVFSAAIRSLSPFRADTPRQLFDAPAPEYRQNVPVRGWDVSADSQQFLLNRYIESTDRPAGDIDVVLNWHEELKRLVPTEN